MKDAKLILHQREIIDKRNYLILGVKIPKKENGLGFFFGFCSSQLTQTFFILHQDPQFNLKRRKYRVDSIVWTLLLHRGEEEEDEEKIRGRRS